MRRLLAVGCLLTLCGCAATREATKAVVGAVLEATGTVTTTAIDLAHEPTQAAYDLVAPAEEGKP